jgi:hypothetical protein
MVFPPRQALGAESHTVNDDSAWTNQWTLDAATVKRSLIARDGPLFASALARAPPAALPLVVLAGAGMPMVVAYELPPAVSSLRTPPRAAPARSGR